ncbi:MAG: arsenate reductase ArsC [Caldilineaceae bacterium]|nr:arsenate reductase ArsC [Caldilineaceae bacterium]
MGKLRVLILCTGNSCRSQMAEGLINHHLSARWEAYSAGSVPSGRVHPLAIAAMAEIGIDISRHLSESVDVYRNLSPDLVITVCDNAAKACPIWLGEGAKAHIPFVDPAEATGSEDERMAIFRAVRDEIAQTVLPFLEEWQPKALAQVPSPSALRHE